MVDSGFHLKGQIQTNWVLGASPEFSGGFWGLAQCFHVDFESRPHNFHIGFDSGPRFNWAQYHIRRSARERVPHTLIASERDLPKIKKQTSVRYELEFLPLKSTNDMHLLFNSRSNLT